jgi:hypothetical protein
MYPYNLISVCGSCSLHSSNPPVEFLASWDIHDDINIFAHRFQLNYILSFHIQTIDTHEPSLHPLHQVHPIWNDVPPKVSILSSIVEPIQTLLHSKPYKQFLDFLLQKEPEYTLYFTGHSSGGLLSQLILLHIVQSSVLHKIPHCITFGKPNPGNLEFARYFNNRVRHCSNYFAKGDLSYTSFHEDTQAIILDNDEDPMIPNNPAYYQRCFINLYKRRQQHISTYDEETSSRIITHFFKTHARHNSLKSYITQLKNTQIMSDWMLTTPFHNISTRLRDNDVIQLAKKTLEGVLFMITRASIKTKLINLPALDENPNVRVFLASFMIHTRPSSCFESIGPLEQSVQTSATALVNTFKEICNGITSPTRITIYQWCTWSTLVIQLKEYLTCFKEWKVPDENKLTERLKHALLALYRAETHLIPNTYEYNSMIADLKSQKKKLRAKMLQIAGKEVLASFDETIKQQGFHIDTPLATNTPPIHGGLSKLPGRMSNEQLAHELLLDPTFQLDDQGAGYIENDVLTKVRESFKVAFWDSLVADLKLNPPCYVRVLKVIGEVRDGIIDLAPNRSLELNEKIDITYWQQQIETGMLDWSSCILLIQGMLGIAMSIQEPSRKEETLTKWKTLEDELKSSNPEDHPTLFCKALEYVLGCVNVMRVDAANARLRKIAIIIQQHGVEYERAHMSKKIKANPSYLQRTPTWLQQVLKKEIEKGRADPQKLSLGDAKEYERIHSIAVLSLVVANEPVEADTCPELLLLDLHRLKKYHLDFHFDVKAACMLAMASQRLLSNNKGSSVVDLLEHLKKSLNHFEASTFKNKIDCIQGFISTFNDELTPPEKELIASCMSPSNKCYSKELLERLLEIPHMLFDKSYGPMEEQWLKILSHDCNHTDMPQSPFIKNVYERILKNAGRLWNVVNLNRKAHFDIYNDLMRSRES